VSERQGTLDAIVAAVVLAAGLLLCVVWAGAAVAAAIAGSAAPPLSAHVLAGVAARLPGHLRNPAAAWPAPWRAALGRAGIYWAATGLVASATASAGWTGVALLRRARRRPLGARPHAGLASHRDLRPLGVDAAVSGRVTLGRHGRRLVAAEPRASVAVIGPTGCGKTAGSRSALLEWAGPVIATSIKGDLVERPGAPGDPRARVGV